MDQLYRNKKKQSLYRVLHHAIDCTNERDGTKVVVYTNVEGEPLVFVREEKEFQEKFERVD
jgi:hypothetical protein